MKSIEKSIKKAGKVIWKGMERVSEKLEMR